MLLTVTAEEEFSIESFESFDWFFFSTRYSYKYILYLTAQI